MNLLNAVMSPALLFASLLVAAAPAFGADAAPAKPDAARGQTLATQVCAACHTFDGSRGAAPNPILQGQHPDYLTKQLTEFKSGKRENAIMKGFASMLSDEDMRNVAAFYAGKQAKPGAARSKDMVELGERIYRGGLADRQVPACAGCHSPNGAGIPAQYPRLSGQHADYTQAQLVAFRGGERANSSQMTDIAARLNDREIKAVSDYIAGLR